MNNKLKTITRSEADKKWNTWSSNHMKKLGGNINVKELKSLFMMGLKGKYNIKN